MLPHFITEWYRIRILKKFRIKERFRVKYENADNIFPEKLLLEIRRFMPEEYVYISPQSGRKEWGSVSGQKKELEKRNSEIYKEYLAGKSIDAISKERYLSKSSIYRILKQFMWRKAAVFGLWLFYWKYYNEFSIAEMGCFCDILFI